MHYERRADLIGPVLSRLAGLAPRPVSLEATGAAAEMLADLVLKHLLRGRLADECGARRAAGTRDRS